MPFSSRIGFLIILATLLLVAPTDSNNLSTDQSSLTALKSYVTSDPKKILKNGWSDSSFVCNWTGVTCGTDPLRVVGLDLSYAGLVGTVPQHLGNLTSLAVLLLTNNRFHGLLPRELSRLSQLKNLSFGFNDLTGEIPPWIGSLPKLQRLWLYGNRFLGSIPISIFNLTSLQIVNLSYNQLSGSIPAAVSNATSLKILDISDNGLTGNIPAEIGRLPYLEFFQAALNALEGPFPQFVFNISSLKTLALTENNFDGTPLPDNICQHIPNIEELYLGQTNINGQIPSKLSECKQLQALNLWGNNLQRHIPKSIANLTSAKEIDLSKNKLTGNIPAQIGRLPYLEKFQVSTNALKGPFPQFVFNISSLKILDLAENSFYETSLPDNICQHIPNIEELYLGQNNINGQIPLKLSECKQLQVLGLGDNNLQGTIPPTLFNITTIKVIDLNFNQLSGGLPLNFGLGVPNLEKLYLLSNNLSGSLPESISNASQLTRLNIGFNHFSGFIPNTLRALNKLEVLNLENNSLTLIESTNNILHTIASFSHLKSLNMALNPLNTSLPSSLGLNISNSLEKLYLYNCNLRGNIPASTLTNFTSLILLNLHTNQFSGSIPPSIGKLQKLQGLYLSTNLLDGPIPLQLCQLQFMSELYLHNNMLSRSIPACLGHITSLRYLYLDSNKFRSAIPSTIWGITDILEVDLSSNSLTGSLSTDVGKLKALTYFSVSSNQLSGNISSSIGDLQSLESLDLGSNNFQGSIPDSMGNLLSLEYLDLSNNTLSGVIPKSMERLSYLTFLNLSYNKLYGEIPSGGPFSNFSAQSFLHNENLCGALRLQVSPCKSAPRKRNKALIMRYVIPSVIVAAILFIMTLIVIAFCRKKSQKLDSEAALVTFRRVSPFELSTATSGFKDENLLGLGGFGSVFKGTLSDGLVVAIKVFNKQLEQAFESFASECQVLCNIRHRNLVKIITCCSAHDFKALVLQYMPHGSLDKWLYSDGAFLNLLQRLNIMIDVASALEYLHYGHSTPIVHCDLKPSNVLLDKNMVAHVSDFGISRVLRGDNSMTQTMTLATIGYMAPEYGAGGVVTRRRDVYSFGIMLMEVFTKKKPTDDMFSEEMNLKEWVQNSMQTEAIESDLLRPEDRDYLNNKECVTFILELALTCSASLPEERIDIKIAISELNKIKKKFIRSV